MPEHFDPSGDHDHPDPYIGRQCLTIFNRSVERCSTFNSVNEISPIIKLRGDWSWHKCALGMQGWGREGASNRCCWKCLADYRSLNFRDFYETALWRATLLNHASFMASMIASNSYISEIFKLPGFRHEMITADLMHCGDLGVLLYLLGIVMWEMIVEMGGVYTNCKGQIQHILSLIRTASRMLELKKQPLNDLTIGMIKGQGKSSPKLKVKASDARHILKCMRYVLEKMRPLDTPHATQRLLVVQNFCDMYEHLQYSVGMTSMQQAATCMRRALILWNELRHQDIDTENPDNWQTRGFFLWKLYPKHHMLQHLLEDQMLITGNPVGHWCYADESEIGAAVSLAATLQYSHLQTSVIKKHRL